MEETQLSTRINTNVTALQAAQNLNANSNNLSGNIQRLSSGLRINSAADDPAGLAISENFKAQISGLTQASKNSNDAINEVKTAEGALNQVQNLLISIRQLAVHASNLGTNSTVDLAADQTQINSAIASINRIASTTSFGNKKLLDGSATSGSSTTAGTTTSVGVSVNAAGLFNSAQAGTYDTISVTAATAATNTFAFTASPLDSTTNTGTYSGSLIINGTQYNLSTAGTSSITDLNSAISASGYQAGIDATGELQFTNQATGYQANPASINIAGLTIGSSAAIDNSTGAATTATGGTVTLNGGTSNLSATLANDQVGTTGGNLILSVNGGNHTLSLTAGQTLDTVNTALNAFGATLSASATGLKISGAASISVTASTATFAQTATSTIGTVGAGGDHNATVTPTGNTKLNTVAASNTVATTGSLVFTDNAVAKTVSVTAGQSWATFAANVVSADAGATASVDASGNLVIGAGGAGHDVVVTAATNVQFADKGSTESTVSGVDGVAATTTYTQTGSATLTSAAALFSGQLTVSSGNGAAQAILTLSPATTLAQLNTSLSASGVSVTVSGGVLTFTSKGGATAPAVTLGAGFSAYDRLTLTSSNTGSVAHGSDAVLTLSNATSTLVSATTQKAGSTSYFNFSNGLVIGTTQTSGAITGNVTSTAGVTTSGESLQFQVGANGGETTSLNIGSTTANLLGNNAASYSDANGTTQTVTTDSIADLNVLTFKGAQDAVAVIDKAINDLSTVRANLGSFQTNVLQSNVTSLGVAQQNLSASLSTIQDTDLSTEIVDYTKNQILVQAGTSALGQANQAPQAILKLLQ